MREPLRENWGLKLVSLALSVLVFVLVRSERQVTTTLAVRLVLREGGDLMNTGDVPGEVAVRVTGSSAAVSSLAEEAQRTIELDVTGLPKGTSTLRVRDEQLDLPSDVSVVSITPSLVTVRLEARERKRVKVLPSLRGEPLGGFEVGAVTVEPKEVTVEGPRRELKELDRVRTVPVDVGGRTQPLNAQVPLEAPGPHTRVVDVQKASVRVEVRQETADLEVRLAVAVPGQGTLPARLTLRGPKSLLDRLDPSRLRARAVSDGKRAPLRVEVDNLPDGVRIAEPATFERARAPSRG